MCLCTVFSVNCSKTASHRPCLLKLEQKKILNYSKAVSWFKETGKLILLEMFDDQKLESKQLNCIAVKSSINGKCYMVNVLFLLHALSTFCSQYTQVMMHFVMKYML